MMLGRALITGGSGSLGQALVARMLKIPCPYLERLVVYSRGWQKQEAMQRRFSDERLRFFIGDVRDRDRLELALRGISVVIHAAAMKSIPACEYNPTECISTNVDGTRNVLQAVDHRGVRGVLVVSSDKAVSPINVYGRSKALAESLTVAANVYSPGTRSSVVRYGNVAGSAGSVLPLFLEKTDRAEMSLPVTDIGMTRFWITMSQAVEFVLHSLAFMVGGEVFVPRLKAASVMELVTALRARARFTGIRPGEKLHETLIAPEEVARARDIGWAYVIEPQSHLWDRTRKQRGQPLPTGFTYSSNVVERLSPARLRETIEQARMLIEQEAKP